MSPILVVDDNVGCRDSVKAVLESQGLSVACANNGRYALKYLRSGLRPSLILLDLWMPEMDGCEFRDIQCRDEELKSIPVVLISGEPYLRSIADSFRVAYLTKPIDPVKLLSVVEDTIGQTGAC
jgi:CheY-like chemotaxis protein